jgi:hypothetical protein
MLTMEMIKCNMTQEINIASAMTATLTQILSAAKLQFIILCTSVFTGYVNLHLCKH